MSQPSALESNIDTLRKYVQTPNLEPHLVNSIQLLITKYGNIKQFEGEDMNIYLNKLDKEVSTFMTDNNIGPVSYDGGRRRKSASSSSRPRRRSSKKRGTQRKQKRRQRRGSRRA